MVELKQKKKKISTCIALRAQTRAARVTFSFKRKVTLLTLRLVLKLDFCSNLTNQAHFT